MSQIHQAAETGSKDRQPLPDTGIINLFLLCFAHIGPGDGVAPFPVIKSTQVLLFSW